MQKQPYEAPQIITVILWTSPIMNDLTVSYGGQTPVPDDNDSYPV